MPYKDYDNKEFEFKHNGDRKPYQKWSKTCEAVRAGENIIYVT
jgi:hypothetical protein